MRGFADFFPGPSPLFSKLYHVQISRAYSIFLSRFCVLLCSQTFRNILDAGLSIQFLGGRGELSQGGGHGAPRNYMWLQKWYCYNPNSTQTLAYLNLTQLSCVWHENGFAHHHNHTTTIPSPTSHHHHPTTTSLAPPHYHHPTSQV